MIYNRWINNCVSLRNIHYFFWLLFDWYNRLLLLIHSGVGGLMLFFIEISFSWKKIQSIDGMNLILNNINGLDKFLLIALFICVILMPTRTSSRAMTLSGIMVAIVGCLLVHVYMISPQLALFVFISLFSCVRLFLTPICFI